MKNENIAKVLKNYRKKNQYTVNDVAIKLNEHASLAVAPKTIYGWESGQTQPDADTLLVLCDIYKISDILETFGYRNQEDGDLNLSLQERQLVLSYRKYPEMQEAVNRLLRI